MHSGYIVASGLRRSNGVQGLRFIVQSEKDATFVEQRVEAFLQHVQVPCDWVVCKEWRGNESFLINNFSYKRCCTSKA